MALTLQISNSQRICNTITSAVLPRDLNDEDCADRNLTLAFYDFACHVHHGVLVPLPEQLLFDLECVGLVSMIEVHTRVHGVGKVEVMGHTRSKRVSVFPHLGLTFQIILMLSSGAHFSLLFTLSLFLEYYLLVTLHSDMSRVLEIELIFYEM